LKKGDLGGFKNQQTERIYGKCYKTMMPEMGLGDGNRVV